MTENMVTRRQFLRKSSAATFSAAAVGSYSASAKTARAVDKPDDFRGQHMQEIKVAAVSTRNWIGEQERSLRNMAQWARRAAREGAELVVFPASLA